MGKRGRPPRLVITKTYRMAPETVEGLRCLATRWGLSRSAALRELIDREVFQTFDDQERARLGIS